MDGEPMVRARTLQEWLTFVAREDDPYRARFFAALPKDVRAAIESASRVSYLSARFHVLFADILLDAFGAQRAHQYYRRAFAQSLKGPLFASLFFTGMRILGMNPGSVLRWADRGWQMAFRHCGRLHGELLGPNVGRLTYLDLPSICTKSDAWLDSAQGSAYGVFDLCEVDGIVRIDKRARSSGRMQLDLEWAPRSK